MVVRGIYEQLWEEIANGHLDMGVDLVESALADRYGTSRTPVREALRRLEQDGLVARSGRGLQVRIRTPDETLEIYEVRIQLEGMAAALAAERHTSLDLARIESCVEHLAEVDAEDPASMVRSNTAFYRAVWHASHNTTLGDLLNRLNSHLTRYPATTLTSPGRWATVLADHNKLAELIGSRDATEARNLAVSHMTAARDLRMRMYASEPAG
jgi:DNA-binding GntR family transcriptional regulator